MLLPYTDPSKAYMPQVPEFSKYIFGTGQVKCAVTDVRDLGKFAARIIADERTLNQYVFCWTEETTQNEMFALAERISGRKFEAKNLSAEEVTRRKEEANGMLEELISGYNHSLWIRGDNVVEKAKTKEYGGALDARELYPDLGKELTSLEDCAKDFYSA